MRVVQLSDDLIARRVQLALEFAVEQALAALPWARVKVV